VRRRLILAAASLYPFAVLAQRHWLIGRWEGEVQGAGGSGGGGPEGPGRVLVVDSVGADGKVTGVFSSRGGGQRTTNITLQGETVRIVSGAGNDITLRRTAANKLEGDYVSTSGRGRRVSVTLTRSG
jgi:hypothetical protein